LTGFAGWGRVADLRFSFSTTDGSPRGGLICLYGAAEPIAPAWWGLGAWGHAWILISRAGGLVWVVVSLLDAARWRP